MAPELSAVRPIGGFFGLESGSGTGAYHDGAVALSLGRACLNLVIQQLQPAKLHVPYYSCDALLAPIRHNRVPLEFYELNAELEPQGRLNVGPNEYVVYINYFGVKTEAARRLAALYPGQLIVDNAQAFFVREPVGLCSFNSARKFFGVADGAYLYFPGMDVPTLERNALARQDHLVERMEGNVETAYQQFLDYERGLRCDIRRPSLFSEELLARVDYEGASERRQANYEVYHGAFGSINRLQVERRDDVPLCYPLLLDREVPKSALHERGIFVPTFWTDVTGRPESGFAFERQVTRTLLPLPLDQRYDATDCRRVIDEVSRLAGG
jgi:hypothetical protein